VARVDAMQARVGDCIKGKDELIRLSLVTMVAGGHLLIEDIPGVGKSTLARALAEVTGGTFTRVQFTSDLLPADLLGINVWRASEERFELRRGPLFANVVLADEVNRAPPRTQSALLEAMAEGTVSIDGVTHELPAPFAVLATQNPQEHHGTYPLPESQRDRFLLRVSMGYAAAEVEAALLADPQSGQNKALQPVLSRPEELVELQKAARAVHLHPDLATYAQAIVQATREDANIRLGVSTRGALAWVAAARALALVSGRQQVSLDDLQDLAVPALSHRILPMQTAIGDQSSVSDELLRELIARTPVPT
jgi:MoxR-like ATPase